MYFSLDYNIMNGFVPDQQQKMSLMRRIWLTFTTNERNMRHTATFVALHHDSCQPLVIITTLRDHEGPGWQRDFDFISDSFKWDLWDRTYKLSLFEKSRLQRGWSNMSNSFLQIIRILLDLLLSRNEIGLVKQLLANGPDHPDGLTHCEEEWDPICRYQLCAVWAFKGFYRLFMWKSSGNYTDPGSTFGASRSWDEPTSFV